ncbi:MAG TPA: glycosyltransferase family 2 protein [Pyrinomonadaceae bacterium]|nr:glycosyltransferase family 2 protein [Pyrinomonadaceae bacterium]
MPVEGKESSQDELTASGDAPRVSVVIVNWNTRELTAQCIATLKASLADLPAEIILVDNDSSDGSAEYIAERHPDVCLVRSGANLGFARGNNLGFKYARGRYLVLLNSDTIVLEGAVQRLVEYLDAHADVAAVGGQHLNGEGEFVPTGLRFPTLWSDLSVAAGLNKFGPVVLKKNQRLARLWYVVETGDVDWLSNSFVAVRREVLDQVGPLPEEFFLYGEDIEWYWRMREAGLRVCYVHGAPIVHLENKSSNQLYKNNDKHYRYLDAFYVFAARHRNPLSWRLGWMANALHWGALGVRFYLRGRLKKDEDALRRAHWLRSFARYHIDQVTGKIAPIAR